MFLSYAREDKSVARRICTAFQRESIDVWFDEESLVAGQKWLPTIKKAIIESDFFLALLSSASVNKRGVVQKEMREALKVLETIPDNQIFIIPVRLDDCQPTFDVIREIHWVDLFQDWTDGIRQILRAIRPEPFEFAAPSAHSPFEEAIPPSGVLPSFRKPEAVRVTDILHEAVESFEKYAQKKNVQINVKDQSKGARITTNISTFQLALFNLLHNAVKYSYSSHDHEGLVSVVSNLDGGTLRISVENVGMGIGRDEIELGRIFERGYQSRSSRRFPGTGMGLYIAREIIRRQSGDISVESKPIRASFLAPDERAPFHTRFEIRLPVAERIKAEGSENRRQPVQQPNSADAD